MKIYFLFIELNCAYVETEDICNRWLYFFMFTFNKWNEIQFACRKSQQEWIAFDSKQKWCCFQLKCTKASDEPIWTWKVSMKLCSNNYFHYLYLTRLKTKICWTDTATMKVKSKHKSEIFDSFGAFSFYQFLFHNFDIIVIVHFIYENRIYLSRQYANDFQCRKK